MEHHTPMTSITLERSSSEIGTDNDNWHFLEFLMETFGVWIPPRPLNMYKKHIKELLIFFVSIDFVLGTTHFFIINDISD